MRVLALMKKEFLQFRRDPALLLIVLWAFTLDIYFAGSGPALVIRNFPVAVYDQDASQASASFIEQLHAPRFRIVHLLTDPRRINQLLDTGEALMVIVIDPYFSRDIARGTGGKVQVLLDGTNSTSASMALAHLSQISKQFRPPLQISKARLTGRAGPDDQLISARLRVLFNPNLEASWSTSLTELFAVITMVSILLPAAAMVREKQYGTIEQLLVGPLHPWQIMIAKIIPMAIIVVGFTAMAVYLVLGWCFGLYPRGSLALFLAVTAIYVFATAGLGMLIATAAKNLSQVILMLLPCLVPILFLSGTWTPPEAMHPAVRWITHVSPLSYYLEIGNGIFFRATTLSEIIEPLIALVILGAAVFLFGATRLTRQLAAS